MPAVSAVLSGAGISRGSPANLPLGDEFHDALLHGCFDAASAITRGAVTTLGLDLLMSGGRRNILGCIEDCLDSGTVAAVLDCMRVRLPTEEHLLCAMLAARGVLQLTLNFDNGIELAYALLTGRAQLPPDAPADYARALVRWRESMPDAPPLRVMATPRDFASRGVGHRPLLVKLRGSVDVGADGTVVPLRPTMEDLECTVLDDDRREALSEAVTGGRLLVIGHSGRDLDVFETLEAMLRPDGFDWIAPDLDEKVAARLGAVDPRQPRRGMARHVLRAELGELPDWPSVAVAGPPFSQRFATWWRCVPQLAAAEAYGWMLSEAGHHGEAVLVLRAVAASTSRRQAAARVRLRLADALARRGGREDLAEAVVLYAKTSRGRSTPAGLRAYAITRGLECRADHAPTVPALLAAAASGAGAALIAQSGHGRLRVMIRVLAGIGRVAVRCTEAGLERRLSPSGRSRTVLVARAAARLLESAWRRSMLAGTVTRQSDLELLRLRADLLLALLRGTPPAPDAPARLAGVERAYAHRGNRSGVVEVQLTRALMLLAARDASGFTLAIHAVGDPTGAELRPRTASEVVSLRTWASRLEMMSDSDHPGIVRATAVGHA
ncbi:hypothetical protein AB0B31_14650 [Catellatospora citrea]|uniref:hypothetical protein n=1 Tax=Catellatospora citrea TaxID=53366 RepID=UPI0033CD4E76